MAKGKVGSGKGGVARSSGSGKFVSGTKTQPHKKKRGTYLDTQSAPKKGTVSRTEIRKAIRSTSPA